MRFLKLLGWVRLSAWMAAVGVIVLYVFFITLASVSASEVASVTAAVAALGTVLTIRGLRVASALADRGGDPRTRHGRNRARERRGF